MVILKNVDTSQYQDEYDAICHHQCVKITYSHLKKLLFHPSGFPLAATHIQIFNTNSMKPGIAIIL